MSHIVTIETQIRDPVAVARACERLQLPPPQAGTHRLFTNEATGLAVRLTGWRYPLVCQVDTGQLQFDHFGGRWGEPAQLDTFMQAYAVEITKLEARRQGHTVLEQPLQDGSIKLTVQLVRGAA